MLSGFCGVRLNTAGVIIGWVGAGWSLLTIVLLSIGISRLDELAKTVSDTLNDPDLDQETISHVLLIVICIYITINAINLAASALLIAGTVKERHLLLVPWLINSGLSLFFAAVYMIYMLLAGISANVDVGSIAVSLISGAISFVLQFYIWFTIYSLYKQIQANRDVQQRLIPATSSSYPSYTKI